MIKRLLLVASTNKRLEKLVSANKLTRGLVGRYVAGTTLQEAIAVTRELRAEGIDVSLDLLGETVDDLAESATATKAYIDAVRAIAENSLGATVSVKLSQLGIGLDPAVCAGHLNELLRAAADVGVLVEVDMEHSSVGPATLEAFRAALPEHPDTRVAIQAAMRRTPRRPRVVHRRQAADPPGQGRVPRADRERRCRTGRRSPPSTATSPTGH